MSKKTKAEKQAYNREYYQRNKEKALDRAKKYYENNKNNKSEEDIEKYNLHCKEYYNKTKDNLDRKAVRIACAKSWYQRNKSRILQERKEWRQQVLGTLEYRFKRSIQSSKKRNIPFLLSLEQFSEVASQPCYYCNNQFCIPVLEGSGLDRIDSSKGYELGNVLSCGFRCNQIKMDDLSVEEAKAAIQSILKIRSEKDNKGNSI